MMLSQILQTLILALPTAASLRLDQRLQAAPHLIKALLRRRGRLENIAAAGAVGHKIRSELHALPHFTSFSVSPDRRTIRCFCRSDILPGIARAFHSPDRRQTALPGRNESARSPRPPGSYAFSGPPPSVSPGYQSCRASSAAPGRYRRTSALLHRALCWQDRRLSACIMPARCRSRSRAYKGLYRSPERLRTTGIPGFPLVSPPRASPGRSVCAGGRRSRWSPPAERPRSSAGGSPPAA